MSSFRGRDVLSIRDFTPADIELVLRTAHKMVPIAVGEKRSRSLEGKILSTLFYEPSTRTRLSFESAMARLGGRALGVCRSRCPQVWRDDPLGGVRVEGSRNPPHVREPADPRDAAGDPRAGEGKRALVRGG